jgi:Tol biopolymer transport system component
VSLERDHYKLFVTDLERLQRRRLIEWDVGEAHWLRDGSEVIFCSPGDKGILQVYRMDATGKNIARLTDEPEGAEWPRPARDGRIAYVAARWKKRLEEVRRLPERIAAKGTLNPYDLIVMGPQGPQTVVRDSLLHDYAWSPDGTMIAWSTYGALELVNLADGLKKELRLAERAPQQTGAVLRSLRWRPDGGAIACWSAVPVSRAMPTAACPRCGASREDEASLLIIPFEGQAITLKLDPTAIVDWLGPEGE